MSSVMSPFLQEILMSSILCSKSIRIRSIWSSNDPQSTLVAFGSIVMPFLQLLVISHYMIVVPVHAKWRLNWQYSPAKLPFRLSDSSATEALASDDEGELRVLIYLIGGCYDDVRSGHTNLATTADISCLEVSSKTLTYDPVLQLFAKRKDALRKRYRHGAVVINGNIWVVGGLSDKGELIPQVDMYDPVHDQWSYIGDLPPDIITTFDLAVYANPNGQNIYVVGGYSLSSHPYQASSMSYKIDVEATLELFNNNKKKQNDSDHDNSSNKSVQLVITKLANMNENRGSISAVAFSHYIFVAGGYTTATTTTTTMTGDDNDSFFCQPPLQTVERYDMTTDTWKYVAMLQTPRANIGLIRYGDVFLAVGGDTRSKCSSSSSSSSIPEPSSSSVISLPEGVIEVFKPSDGLNAAWKSVRIEPMDGRMHFVAFSWSATNSILLFGGIINGPEGCNCYFATDKVLVYSLTDEEISSSSEKDYDVVFSSIGVVTVLVVLSYLLLLIIRNWIKRRNNNKLRIHRTNAEAISSSDAGDDDYSETMGIVMQRNVV